MNSKTNSEFSVLAELPEPSFHEAPPLGHSDRLAFDQVQETTDRSSQSQAATKMGWPIQVTSTLVWVVFIVFLYFDCYLAYNHEVLYPAWLATTILSAYFYFEPNTGIPALCSGLLLLFSAALLFIISCGRSRAMAAEECRYWRILSAGFLLVAFDEFLQLHRNFAHFGQFLSQARSTPALHYAWLLHYLVELLAVLWIYRGLISKLPSKIRDLFITSFVIYLLGALGLTLLEGVMSEIQALNSLTAAVFFFSEELMRTAAIALFIYALLKYLVLISVDRE